MLNINELDFDDYPEITALLQGSLSDLEFIQIEYEFFQHGHTESASILEICAAVGRVETLNLLLKVFAFTNHQLRVAFIQSLENSLAPAAERLFEIPAVFEHFEKDLDYADEIELCVDLKLIQLSERKQKSDPEVIFDLNADEFPMYLVALRNLIRRNNPMLMIHIEELLQLPRMHHMPHHSGRELYLLARQIGNLEVCHRLEMLPNLEGIVEDTANEDEDLYEIATDEESSIRGLTPSEQALLDSLDGFYKKQLVVGDLTIIDAFKTKLENRYRKNPAIIKLTDGQSLTLPFTWEEFQALQLDEESYKKALIAYYRNNDHTAHRWLSKPNHWIDANALYVEENTHHPEWGKYANFEAYIPLIARLWLAASDVDTPAINSYTIEGRIELFITALALIGRGHNWDKKRPKIDPSDPQGEKFLRDQDGEIIMGLKFRDLLKNRGSTKFPITN